MDLKSNFSSACAKKIFGNSDRATEFLLHLQKARGFSLPMRTMLRGKNSGQTRLDLANSDIWTKVVENWDYDCALPIIREMFTETEKYESGKNSHKMMKLLLDEWEYLKLGTVDWPFSQGAFDDFVQGVNAQKTDGPTKDERVRKAAVQYRRIKEINAVRNDYIETLIFEKNKNVLPTLRHGRLVDFFISGKSFDQKVSRGPTNEFKKEFGVKWKSHAIEHPEVVAEYLYSFQDEGRFGADSRLLVVYLDPDVSIDEITSIIEKTDLQDPLEVTFVYSHENQDEKMTYKVTCFVILLYSPDPPESPSEMIAGETVEAN